MTVAQQAAERSLGVAERSSLLLQDGRSYAVFRLSNSGVRYRSEHHPVRVLRAPDLEPALNRSQ